ncbi:MAG TPA: STM3941 family protein [Chitinophagaceae bacterium]|nr:STM3941 family protein [Chitinophagaceae bacterium]
MTVTANQTCISFDKKKMRRKLFVAIILMAVGIWYLVTPLFNAQLQFSGYFFIFVSIILASYSVKRLTSNKPGFLIDMKGIQGYSGTFYFDPILWSDISKVKITKVLWQKLIVVIINDPQAYINKQENVFKKLPMNLNDVFLNSPICINTEELNISVDELFELIDSNLKRQL